MSKTYFLVAKYVPDQLRFEPRNIGVMIIGKHSAAARFMGEDQVGHLDLRRLPADLFNDRQVYAEWQRYWRKRTVAYGNAAASTVLEPLLAASRGAFLIWDGGQVPSDQGVDQALADELFSKIVEPWSAPPAGEVGGAAPPAKPLSVRLFKELKSAFTESGILESTTEGGSLFAKHAIRIEKTIDGTLPVPHRPRFSQLNGKLWVMEQVDFTEPDDAHIREHALYASYMLADIHEARRNDPGSRNKLELIAIVKRNMNDDRESQRYGLAALEKVPSLRLVKWDEPRERDEFLNERVAVAGTVGRDPSAN